MANTDAKYGLRPVRHMTGGCIRTNEYSIANEYNTDIFTGDVVEMTGTGTNIAKAAAANADNIGVFAGCRYVDSTGDQQFKPYWPNTTTATEIVAYVYDDPDIIYQCQIGESTALAEANIGQLVDWHVGTGSTSTGQSGLYANESTLNATDRALRILRLVPRPDNAYGLYADIEVMFVEHAMSGVVVGAGGV